MHGLLSLFIKVTLHVIHMLLKLLLHCTLCQETYYTVLEEKGGAAAVLGGMEGLGK